MAKRKAKAHGDPPAAEDEQLTPAEERVNRISLSNENLLSGLLSVPGILAARAAEERRLQAEAIANAIAANALPSAKSLTQKTDTLDSGETLERIPQQFQSREDLTGLRLDIWRVLEKAGHRMTEKEISCALSLSGLGASGLKTPLATMVDCKILTNRSDVRPRGYGLPEWDEQS